MKQILNGAEIWDIIKHPLLNENDWIKNKQYEFELTGGKGKNGVLNSISKPIPTAEEQAELDKRKEILELNEWLDLRRNIDHPDKATKQARLLELLG